MLLETFVSFIYSRWVNLGDNVIDAGVNTGLHFFPLLRTVGQEGFVIGFEANPTLVDKVQNRANSQGIKNYYLHQKALFNKPGSIKFIIYPDRLGQSHIDFEKNIQPRHETLKSKETLVEAVTLDDLSIEKLSFIKMDLEGADFRALQGGSNLLHNCNPLVIFETGYAKLEEFYGVTQTEFLSFFKQINYLLFDIHGIPVTEYTWNNRLLGYEFIAIHQDDIRLSTLMIEISRFWTSCLSWPIIKSWDDCLKFGKVPPFLTMI
jgi:FkbM family methyltransferase